MAEAMRELNYDFDTLGSRVIPLGYQGESMQLQIRIDCAEAIAAHGAVSAALKITAPDGTEYPGDWYESQGVLLWQVKDRDTAIAGSGSVCVELVDAMETVVYSAVAMTVILEENAREADNLRSIQIKVGQLLECCDEVQETITELGSRMEEAEDGLDDMQSVVTDKDVAWTEALASASARMAAIEEILEDLQEEVAALEGGESGSIATLIADMQQAQADIADLQSGASSRDEAIASLQESLSGIQTSITNINSSISTINGKLVFESTPTASSNKLIRSKDLKTLFDAKQNTLTFDNSPTSGSSNPVKSGGVYTALAAKQNTLTFDNSPTSGSNNPVKSSGIYTALAGKQATLTFDSTPTANSNNPVKSSGIKTALDAKQNTLTFDSSPTSDSNNPVKSGGVYTAIHAKDAVNFTSSVTFETPATASRFVKHGNSMCTVEYYASVTFSNSQFTLFTLPSGYRPKVKTYIVAHYTDSTTLASDSNSYNMVLELNTNGVVKRVRSQHVGSTHLVFLNFSYSIV